MSLTPTSHQVPLIPAGLEFSSVTQGPLAPITHPLSRPLFSGVNHCMSRAQVFKADNR